MKPLSNIQTFGMALSVFEGRAGDRNCRAMQGSAVLGDFLSRTLDIPQFRLGTPQPPLHESWDRELEVARSDLTELASRLEHVFEHGLVPLSVTGRCAASLATLPVVARLRPDAVVVWFDAHADCNMPSSVARPYLGGIVLTGTAGMWDSGLGAGMPLSKIILVGSRDIDPDELLLIDSGAPHLVRVGNNLTDRLSTAIGDHPVYVHLDCDVLEPGIVPTEYRSQGGLTLGDLRAAFDVLAGNEVAGLEVAEFEATWPGSDAVFSPKGLIDAIRPLLSASA
jgi:arginase